MASEIPKIPPSPAPTAAGGAGASASDGKADFSPIATVFRRVIEVPSDEAARRDLDALAKTLTQDHLIEYTDKLSDDELDIFLSVTHSVSPETLRTVVEGIAKGIRSLYIDETKASAMAEAIETAYHTKRYNEYTSPLALKRAILEDLRAVCDDKHLNILYCRLPHETDSLWSKLEHPKPEDIQKEDEKYIEDISSANWGITSSFTDGVGYIKIDKFPPAHFEGLKTALDDAFRTVAGAKALIIDLRDNEGGNPEAVALVASYLFDKPLEGPLCTVYERSSDRTTATYIHPEEHPIRFGVEKPVLCLTSEKTFSAGEELAYDLQVLKRATIIGEKQTKGGAHPTRAFEIVGTHFTVMIPNERAISPYTGTNWEGVGVRPDIVTSYDDALSKAEEIAKGL